MKLSHYKKANLDARYTWYDPDQELENDESMVQLCCAIHGPYEVQSKYLKQEYLKRHLYAARCPGCKDDALSDSDYRMQISLRLKAYNGDKVQQMLYPVHPDWKPLDHWCAPKLLFF